MAGNDSKTAVDLYVKRGTPVVKPPEDEPEIIWQEPAKSEQWRQAWKSARPHNRQDIMLDVIKDTGECFSFEYAFLNPIRFDGGDVLELDFGSYKVRIEGRLLKPLRRALKCHAVDFIQEGNDQEDAFKPEGECHIDRITVINLEEKGVKKEEA